MKRKKTADIKSYMKFNETENRYDPYSFPDDFIEELKPYSPIYTSNSNDKGRLDSISHALYGSPNYEEIIGVINRIGDQFQDLSNEKQLKIFNISDLRQAITEVEIRI